jgi:hypothetical protein
MSEGIKLTEVGFKPASQRSKDSIDRFLVCGLESFESALINLKSIPKKDRPDWMQKSIDYYTHCVGATKWLRSMNTQRKTG